MLCWGSAPFGCYLFRSYPSDKAGLDYLSTCTLKLILRLYTDISVVSHEGLSHILFHSHSPLLLPWAAMCHKQVNHKRSDFRLQEKYISKHWKTVVNS